MRLSDKMEKGAHSTYLYKNHITHFIEVGITLCMEKY